MHEGMSETGMGIFAGAIVITTTFHLQGNLTRLT